MGLMGPCMLPLQTLGVPYAGFIYDRTGSYDAAFLTFEGAFAFAACVLLVVTRRQPVAQAEPQQVLEEA